MEAIIGADLAAANEAVRSGNRLVRRRVEDVSASEEGCNLLQKWGTARKREALAQS